ncbi:hypothetical protein SLEP1_g44207 [Rubroshorea leprosula]|uniref:Uncharacterized protein n=1 Tax=Rubroshorea leprosula TaxID=152421 RepID=A0AAV5LFJ8_9ROSI|nr:hypothetical protein SLEP1_g44207 [Rubroshorea leprosula]
MANSTAPKTVWMKQAEEAKIKSEAEKAAAAKAAFEATFKDVEKNQTKDEAVASSDSEFEDDNDLENKPIGPVDPSKCTAAGPGIAGGTACNPSTFVVLTKDADGRKVLIGGAQIKVKISPGMGVGGSDQEGVVKDIGDGTYSVTYVVPKRGDYMLNIECNGKPIMGSPFPVFFSAGSSTGGVLGVAPTSTFPNLVNQTMPNMPNYTGSFSGATPGLLGMIPGAVSGTSGGVILPGIGASLGEVCREYLNGRCAKTDCKLNHPPHNLLMTALAATTSMGTLTQAPMAPSAAAMAAAQAIVAAQALQAHAAQMQAQAQSNKDLSDSSDKAAKDEALKKTLQVSNLNPLLTAEQLKQLFSFCGTVVECTITDSKHFAYIEYSKPEEATAALALNNMDIGGRPLNVEMAKALPPKPSISSLTSSSLPMMMQQAVAVQQMQFQQALLMQQTMAAQQAANKAASMKSATELAAARAAEISKKLKADGLVPEGDDTKRASRSPSTSRARSKSKSRSPVNYRRRSRSKSRSPISYHRRRRSRSYSPLPLRRRNYRSKSPLRSHHRSSYNGERRSYREFRDSSDRSWKRDSDRSNDHYSSISRRNRSRSVSPQTRKSHKVDSGSPRHRRESSPHGKRKLSNAGSKSPKHNRGNRSSPRNDSEEKQIYRKCSRSKSHEDSDDKVDEIQDEKLESQGRRRSRSLSAEGKHQRRSRSSTRSSDEKKTKHRRKSRSKSVEGKHHLRDTVDEDDESKPRDRRRARSRSAEGLHHTKDNRSRDKKSKHHDRRRYRSRSAEVNKHHKGSRSSKSLEENKSEHRSSRSKSLEGPNNSSDRLDENRNERSKHHDRKSSTSAEGKHHKQSRSSPRTSEDRKSKHRRHPISKSAGDDGILLPKEVDDSRAPLNDDQDLKSTYLKSASTNGGDSLSAISTD